MEDKKDLGTLPAALGRRQRILSLSDGQTVTVSKFSLTKTLAVFEYLASLFKDVPKEELELLQGNAVGLSMKILHTLGDKAPGLLRMCVSKDDEQKLSGDTDFDDCVSVLAGCLELNVTETLTKKVAELKELFGRMK
jgi:hypothetical protein